MHYDTALKHSLEVRKPKLCFLMMKDVTCLVVGVARFRTAHKIVLYPDIPQSLARTYNCSSTRQETTNSRYGAVDELKAKSVLAAWGGQRGNLTSHLQTMTL